MTAPRVGSAMKEAEVLRLTDGGNQLQLMQRLLDAGIAARRGVMCSHREAPYLSSEGALPHSERAQDLAVILPLFTQLHRDEIRHIVQAVKMAVSVPTD